MTILVVVVTVAAATANDVIEVSPCDYNYSQSEGPG
jgi:hypothetical protein